MKTEVLHLLVGRRPAGRDLEATADGVRDGGVGQLGRRAQTQRPPEGSGSITAVFIISIMRHIMRHFLMRDV